MSDFHTSDLALCAYLHLEGFGHSRIERVDDKRAEMVFEDGDDLHGAVEEYRTGNATVEPREFMRKVGWTRGLLLDAVKAGRGH